MTFFTIFDLFDQFWLIFTNIQQGPKNDENRNKWFKFYNPWPKDHKKDQWRIEGIKIDQINSKEARRDKDGSRLDKIGQIALIEIRIWD